MENRTEKILILSRIGWCDAAARMLAATLRGVPCFGVDDYRREVEAGQTHLLRAESAGVLVGFVLLRIEKYAHGAEGVLLAAAGKLAGADMLLQVLPALEKMFHGVKSYRIDTCRSAMVKKLMGAGYMPTHFTMRKAARPEVTVEQRGAAALEQLAALDSLGGPDLRGHPGGRLHKGGTSQSSTVQETTSIDRRLVVDTGSVGISSDTSTVNLSLLDGGAIQGAIDVLKQNDANDTKTLGEMLGFAKDVFTSGLSVLDKAGTQIDRQTSLVATAYDNAKGEGTQKNLLAAAALAAVAIVALKSYGKR